LPRPQSPAERLVFIEAEAEDYVVRVSLKSSQPVTSEVLALVDLDDEIAVVQHPVHLQEAMGTLRQVCGIAAERVEDALKRLPGGAAVWEVQMPRISEPRDYARNQPESGADSSEAERTLAIADGH
jgi:hypothetical protein